MRELLLCAALCIVSCLCTAAAIASLPDEKIKAVGFLFVAIVLASNALSIAWREIFK